MGCDRADDLHSAKGLLYHDYLANPEESRSTFYVDPVLINPNGHELMADVLISYFQNQICSGWAATMGHAFDVPYMGAPAADGLGSTDDSGPTDEASLAAKMRDIKVPHAMLSDRPSDILRFREVAPFCVSANNLINPLPPSHFYGSGWTAHHPTKGEGWAEEKHYWYAELGGAKFRVPVNLSAGDVAVYYLQSVPPRLPIALLRPTRRILLTRNRDTAQKALGKAACWVDDNYAGAFELTGVAEVGDTTPTLTLIDRAVAAGPHYVECSLMGAEGETVAPFKILGM